MFIYKIVYQYRRDFRAIFECEGCGNRVESTGYDDEYFHNEVIPKMMRCISCGKTAKDLGTDYRPLTPKYPEGHQI